MGLEVQSICCQNSGNTAQTTTDTTPVANNTTNNSKNTASGSYTTELQQGLSKIIKLYNNKLYIDNIKYSKPITSVGHALTFTINGYVQLDKGGTVHGVKQFGSGIIDLMCNKNRYKIIIKNSKSEYDSKYDDLSKKYNEIMSSKDVVGSNYTETLQKFEKLVADKISNVLYDKFSGSKYEKLDGGELLEICKDEKGNYTGPYTKEKLLDYMKTKKLDLVYLAYRQSKGKVLITNPNKLRVVLRCGKENAITWTIDSNAGAGAGWVGFRMLQEGSGV